ncbi:MAG: AAA family ATPase [Bacillota bacterium]
MTGSCNFACKYCYAGEHPQRMMSETTALKAISLAAADAAPFVLQFSGGEPLLAFDLIRKITDYVRRRRIPALVQLQTNILKNESKSISLKGVTLMRTGVYPFTAIVGQEDMKLALILNVINPALGGVLIKGEKGTAKSTAVRALADLLPEMETVKGCPFHCDPQDRHNLCELCLQKNKATETLPTQSEKMKVVELPVNATEDRVVGTLDIEKAIKNGEKQFEPGILAQANRNILYVDEINLLDDHVVDVLLDAAAMGVNTVEREGVSYIHPSRFVLVGTMNPEEGDIRPQLLDRFGLSVTVTGDRQPEARVEVLKRRLAYELDPDGFAGVYQKKQDQLGKAIVQARRLLPQVTIDDALLTLVAQMAIQLKVDGHRADITVIKAAFTLAAFAGRNKVATADLKKAIRLAMPHRMRRRPFEETVFNWDEVEAMFQG